MEFIGNYTSGATCRCGKRCYTREDAQGSINSLKKHHRTSSHVGRGANVPKRAYHCDMCNMWHLTHLKNAPTVGKPKMKMKVWANDSENDYDRIRANLRGGSQDWE